MLELWMCLVGISMSLAGIPQIYRIWKRETSDDISILYWSIIVFGVAWWLYYGIAINSISLIITNSICLVLDLFVLRTVVKYRTSTNVNN